MVQDNTKAAITVGALAMNNKKGSHLYYRVVSFLILFYLISCSILSAMDKLPPIPQASTFSHEIKLDHLERTNPSDSPLIYSWDFSKKQKIEYTYSKKNILINYTHYPGVKSGASATKSELSGNLQVKSNGDHTADIMINDLAAFIDFGLDEDLEQDQKVFHDNIPNYIVNGVKEDGNTHQTGTERKFMLGFLFPLPKDSLTKNKKTQISRSLPVNLNGVKYNLTGETKIYLTGFFNSDRNVFAYFKTETDLSGQQDYNEIDGTSFCSMKARASYLFDVKRRIIFSGKAAILTGCRSTGKNIDSVAFDDDSLIAINLDECW